MQKSIEDRGKDENFDDSLNETDMQMNYEQYEYRVRR
jgi:hypothetical protein